MCKYVFMEMIEKTEKIDIKLKLLQNLGDLVQNLQKNARLTNQNLPLTYIDPQVILEEITDKQVQNVNEISQETINLALITIDYLEGIPIISGLPFWERLDCEPLDYYKIFKFYRDIKLTEPTRSFEKTAKSTNQKETILYALSKIYHWQQRVQSFDLYQLDVINKIRSKQVDQLENKHQKGAEKLFTMCLKYMENLDTTQLIAKVKPADIKDWMELAVKLERLSLGLSPDKPITKEDTKKVNTVIVNQTTNQIDSKTDNKTINITSEEHKKDLQEIADTLRISTEGIGVEIIENDTNNSSGDDK